MTTIATNGYSVAADGKAVFGNSVISRNTKKLARYGDEIHGACGNSDECLAYHAWAAAGFDADEMPKLDNINVLIVSKKGVWIAHGPHFHRQKANKITAIGSGGDFAEGAMLHGAVPWEAVRIASKRDNNTGGSIQWMSVE